MDLKKIITPFKVGLVSLSAVLSFVYMFGKIEQDTLSEEQSYEVYVILNDASGLAPMSRVLIAGIPVGQISKISLEGDKAKIELQISKEIKLFKGTPQPDGTYRGGATVAKRSASLLGENQIVLTPGFEGEELSEGDQISTILEEVSIQDIMVQLNKITGDVSEVTESLKNVFGSKEGEESLAAILASLRQLTAQVDKWIITNIERFDQIVINVQQVTENLNKFTQQTDGLLHDILKNVEVMTDEGKKLVSDARPIITKTLGKLENTMDKLDSGVGSMNQALANIDEISGKINKGEGTVGKLVNDPAIADKVELVLTDADKVIVEAGEFIESFSELKTFVELREDYNFLQGAIKSTVGVRFQPHEEKYYLFELIVDPRGKTNIQRTVTYTTDSSEDPTIKEEKITTTDDMKFSIQIARRWGFITGRFGLVENSGGIGANVHLFDDNLEFRFDLFDFDLNLYPRLRWIVNYQLFPFLYISGGVDDIFNGDTRDYFLGLGINFDDEDLKTIFMAAPAIPL